MPRKVIGSVTNERRLYPKAHNNDCDDDEDDNDDDDDDDLDDYDDSLKCSTFCEG